MGHSKLILRVALADVSHNAASHHPLRLLTRPKLLRQAQHSDGGRHSTKSNCQPPCFQTPRAPATSQGLLVQQNTLHAQGCGRKGLASTGGRSKSVGFAPHLARCPARSAGSAGRRCASEATPRALLSFLHTGSVGNRFILHACCILLPWALIFALGSNQSWIRPWQP